MADVATWFVAPEWVNYGLTPTYSSGTVYTLAGNQTAIHSVGRRVRTFNTGGTVYGTIATSVYTTITTVTITPDSGTLDSGLSEVDVGILNPLNPSSPPIAPVAYPGRLLNVQRITASSTYTPTTGANSAIVYGAGSGGASGGTLATGSGQGAGSAGGSAGAFAVIRIASGLVAQTVTVGSAGAGTAGNGGAGQTCSFGALMVLPGGPGGATGLASAGTIPSAPGGPSAAPSGTGTFLVSSAGPSGSPGLSYSSSPVGGNPGVNFFGVGGFGAGGQGAGVTQNLSAGNGNPGFTGGFLVFEYS